MRLLYILTLSFLTGGFTFAQDTTQPVIDLEVAPLVSVSGDLRVGHQIPLGWAANSSVACFPATRFIEYRGNHVFYRIILPPYSIMKIKLSPKDSKNRINLYALRLGMGSEVLPPDIDRAVSCEASYPIWAGSPNPLSPAEPQSVEYLSIRNPYSILIGVAGAEKVQKGEFDLEIEISER